MSGKINDLEADYPDELSHLAKFLKDIFKMDQSDPGRSHAPECLQLLLDKKNDFLGTPLEKFFWNSVSLEAFHIAQNEALNKSSDGVKKYLSQSIHAAQKGISDEWFSYVNGTKCYFEGDMNGLRKEISKTKGANMKILTNLLSGYSKRGHVNYSEDYSNV